MRFTLQLPTDRVAAPAEFLTGAAIGEMARAAELAGFDAAFVTDHPAPGDRWLASGGHHALDPFVALAFAAAATTRLRLQTHVLIAAYRNPFLAAKALASLDVASGGRLIAGTAAGYLEPEFAALGAPFDERNELADELLGALKRIWTESSVALAGRHFSASGNTALPRPLQTPHPPLWVGGNSRRAIRRAVELGDGWLPFPAPGKMAARVGTAALENEDDLARGIAYAREHAARIGRSAPLDVCFSPFGLDMRGDGLPEPGSVIAAAQRLAALGVTWLAITLPPCARRAEWLERAGWFGREVVAHAR
jgi:probable F420-dependent oxidoreductase